jgi:importin subunit beta-1
MRTLAPQVLLRVFACRSATVHEEALLAVGAFTYATGKQFVKYMDSFFPVLLQGLTNHQVAPPSPFLANMMPSD